MMGPRRKNRVKEVGEGGAAMVERGRLEAEMVASSSAAASSLCHRVVVSDTMAVATAADTTFSTLVSMTSIAYRHLKSRK